MLKRKITELYTMCQNCLSSLKRYWSNYFYPSKRKVKGYIATYWLTNVEYLPKGHSYYNKDVALANLDGSRYYYSSTFKGLLHREDGPAIEWPSGHKSWYINGHRLTEEEWKLRTTRLGKALYL